MTTNSILQPSLSVSIVAYRSDPDILLGAVSSLLVAVERARAASVLGSVQLDLIHNALPDEQFSALIESIRDRASNHAVGFQLYEGHGNIGYGRGHNLSIHKSSSDYHLILNPDVTLSPDCLTQGLQYLLSTSSVVAISPAVRDGDGNKQYACKRFPSVLNFLLRGFAPAVVRRRFATRLAQYELQELSEDAVTTAIPIISGCFMLFRTSALQSVSGFDERYFLYFEDFDLSLRVQAEGTLAYVPTMHITHLGGHSARKGLRHIGMFVRSGIRFYNTHGWRLL